jgi:hypothetical protein
VIDDMRTARFVLFVWSTAIVPSFVFGQESSSFKVNPLKEEAPKEISKAIRETLSPTGFRVVDDQGKPVFDLWLRKTIPVAAKPSGPSGPVLFPVLNQGELVGAMRRHIEGRDFRDQTIAPGVYTLRYGLQPVNGDHLGTSATRDFLLGSQASRDQSIDPIAEKPLSKQSAEAAGTNHPAVMQLINPPDGSAPPAIGRDEAKNQWGVVVSFDLAVKGESKPVPLAVQIVFEGIGMI